MRKNEKTWCCSCSIVSDVVDVVDTRSFDVKDEVTFDIRQPCYSHAIEKEKRKMLGLLTQGNTRGNLWQRTGDSGF